MRQTEKADSIFRTKIVAGLHRGYYMSAHVLLNLLNELGEK